MDLPHWSQTSVQRFLECPKAWALTYVHTGARGPINNRQHSPSTIPHRTQVRAARATLIEQLEALYNGEIWSDEQLDGRLMTHLEQTDGSGRRYPFGLEGQRATCLSQLRTLKRTKTLRLLHRQRIATWAYFERSQAMVVSGVRLFAAPDIMLFHQHKWTLVRLRFAPEPYPLVAEIEARLMIHWAMAHPALPSRPSAYRLRTITWRQGGWHESSPTATQTEQMEAWSMALTDVNAMQLVRRQVHRDGHLAAVPLATKARACKACSWRSSCLGDRSLASAKRDQLESLLTLHQNEANKSAKTASTS